MGPAGPPNPGGAQLATDGKPWSPPPGSHRELPPVLPIAAGWAMGAMVGLVALNARTSPTPMGRRFAIIGGYAFAGLLVAVAAFHVRMLVG